MEQFDILENILILFLADSWMRIYVCVLGENEARWNYSQWLSS